MDRAILNSSTLHQHCFEQAQVPLLVIDHTKSIMLANQAARNLLPHQEIEGVLIDLLFQPSRYYDEITLPDGHTEVKLERRVSGKDHLDHTYSIEIKHLQGDDQGYFLATLLNHDHIESADKSLADMAFRDMLTGCFNRNYLNTMFTMDAPTPWDVTLYFFDLDKFKYINDLYGHRAGDEVLQQFAHRVKAITRESDKLIRMGGDEFCLITFRNNKYYEQVCLKIIEQVDIPFETYKGSLSVGCSIGVVRANKADKDLTTLLSHADQAMYAAKASQYSRFKEFHSGDHYPDAICNLELLEDLKKAIKNKEIYCVYQPVYNPNREIVSLEALARWHHEKMGFISPLKFIELAFNNKLLATLERYIFQSVTLFMAQLKELNVQRPVHINVTNEWLDKKNNIKHINQLLDMYFLSKDMLILEITEDSIYTENTFEVIDQLVNEGYNIYIDDFGTGFSNLQSIKASSAQVIKFDRSLVVNQGSDDFTKYLVDACKSIGKKVLYEGVETEEEMQQALMQGADLIQGFYLSNPLSAESTKQVLLNSTMK